MMPLPLTPDSFWEYVFPRVEKLWPRQEPGGCRMCCGVTMVLGQEMSPVPAGQLCHSSKSSMGVQASGAAVWLG